MMCLIPYRIYESLPELDPSIKQETVYIEHNHSALKCRKLEFEDRQLALMFALQYGEHLL